MSSPCYTEVILTEKGQIVSKPEKGDWTEEKDFPKGNEETKTYGLGINSA